MSRADVREFKRKLFQGTRPDADDGQSRLAKESALALLERSIRFGHGRLAVIRLGIAVQAGADIPPDCWSYCRDAIAECADLNLRGVWIAAVNGASERLSA